MPSRPRKPVRVEFVGILPTLFATCQHCMEVMHEGGMEPYSEQLEEYPEDIKKQYFELSEIAQKVKNEFRDAVLFDAIDAASARGVWMTIRHRILRTPAVLIDGRRVFDRLPTYEELRREVLEAINAPSISNKVRQSARVRG